MLKYISLALVALMFSMSSVVAQETKNKEQLQKEILKVEPDRVISSGLVICYLNEKFSRKVLALDKFEPLAVQKLKGAYNMVIKGKVSGLTLFVNVDKTESCIAASLFDD